MSEKAFENRIKAWLKDHGCFYVKFFANNYTVRGIPDILTCVNGYFVGIEVKDTGGRPTDIQIQKIKKIRESGGFAWIVYPGGWDELKEYLTVLLNDGETHLFSESEVLK